MNKLFLLSFLLLAGCSRAFSQQKNKLWYLTVTDSLNRNRIERATVSAGRSIYVTGADGSAAINRGLIKTGDTIQISCVGYQTITIIPVAGRKMPDTVRLMTVTNSLREVRIHPVNPIILGDARK
ncbi:MAG TPA: hypothetical protein VHC47_05260, partial [Mucilaginibacter sp.]|nr:hypothetical protein [Mucilaginibacter sp.]